MLMDIKQIPIPYLLGFNLGRENTKAHTVREPVLLQPILVSGVQCGVEKLLMQLYLGPCHKVSAEIAVVMTVLIENPADCQVRGVVLFCRPMRS